jgi:hypothetical protein
MLLPPGETEHERPDRQIVSSAFHDLSDTEAAHHRTQLDWWDVGTHLTHPDAVCGVKREVQGADQRLPFVNFRNGLLYPLEVPISDLALRPALQTK